MSESFTSGELAALHAAVEHVEKIEAALRVADLSFNSSIEIGSPRGIVGRIDYDETGTITFITGEHQA